MSGEFLLLSLVTTKDQLTQVITPTAKELTEVGTPVYVNSEPLDEWVGGVRSPEGTRHVRIEFPDGTLDDLNSALAVRQATYFAERGYGINRVGMYNPKRPRSK